jgi:hypothetical protein
VGDAPIRPAAICPQCGVEPRECWVSRRRYALCCHRCYWQGEPYDPPRIAVKTSRDLTKHVQHAPGLWCFTVTDRHGQVIVDAHNVEAEAVHDDGLWHLDHADAQEGYGPCTLVLWPPDEVQGIVVARVERPSVPL